MKLIEEYIKLINENQSIINFLFWELKRNPEIVKLIQKKILDMSSSSFYVFLKEKMEEAHSRCEIKKVDPMNFFINLISLSGFIYLNLNIFTVAFNLTDEQTNQLLVINRKDEIFRLLWNDIKT